MQGIKSCYIAKTISLEIARGTLLGYGSPKQLLEAHKEKHGSSPMSGSAAPRSWFRKQSLFMSLADYQAPWHFKAVLVFKYNEVFG